MVLELVFTSHPSSKERILFGIQEKDTVDELATLYKTTYDLLVVGNIDIEMPSQAKANTLQIKSTELKHLFKNYESKLLRINDPNPKSLITLTQTLRLP